MCQHLYISTNRSINTAIHQHLESIYQHRDTSTTQFINTAIYQHLDLSTPQYTNTSNRYINTAIHWHLESGYQHWDRSTPQFINSLVQYHISTPWNIHLLLGCWPPEVAVSHDTCGLFLDLGALVSSGSYTYHEVDVVGNWHTARPRVDRKRRWLKEILI